MLLKTVLTLVQDFTFADLMKKAKIKQLYQN